LINGRVTDRSFAKYKKRIGDTKRILALFDAYLMQEKQSAERLNALGAPAHRITTIGSIKTSADPLPDLAEPRLAFEAVLAGRPVWLAVSTSGAEEDQLFCAHAIARKTIPDLLLVIAPRHIKFADQTQALAQAVFEQVTRRSTGAPLTPDTEVYIADSFGEMGLWCRVCPFVFIGHSMPNCVPPLTGKNPFEALILGQMVAHGPDFANFAAIYKELLAARATLQVQDSTDLAAAIVRSFGDLAWRSAHVEAARGVIAQGQSAIDLTQDALQQAVAISTSSS
jgi:3-deoxy-D-manno-octulosonic-acid transferase